jgi:hypothetical protein
MKKGGAAVAGPIWSNVMTEALKNMPTESFEKPDLTVDPHTVKPVLRGLWQGNDNFFIDTISKKLATEFTPPETTEEKVITNVHSILYWVDKGDILGPPPVNPENDPQFNHWEIPVQNWWLQNKDKYPVTTLADKPAATDDVHTSLTKPVISILTPDSVTVYPPNQKIYLKISSSSIFPLQKIDIFINGVYLETDQSPFDFSFTPAELENLQDANELRIIAYDTAYNKSETSLTFKVGQ